MPPSSVPLNAGGITHMQIFPNRDRGGLDKYYSLPDVFTTQLHTHTNTHIQVYTHTHLHSIKSEHHHHCHKDVLEWIGTISRTPQTCNQARTLNIAPAKGKQIGGAWKWNLPAF